MARKNDPGANAPSTRVTRGKAKAAMGIQPVAQSSVRLGSPIDDGLSNKRRRTNFSVQISSSNISGSSAVSSASSVTYGREEIDTPATTVSTQSDTITVTNRSISVKGQKLLGALKKLHQTEASESVPTTRRRCTRHSQVSGISLNSGGEEESDEADGEESADESEEDEFKPSEDDSDEFMETGEEEEEVSTFRKGKGKARAVPEASTSAETAATDSDSELSEIPEELLAGYIEQFPQHGQQHGPQQAATLTSNTIARAPQHVGNMGTRSQRQMEALYYWHPELRNIWDYLDKLEKIQIQPDPQPEGLTLTMLPFQLEGLHWLRGQEKTAFGGGILADEMGMGKTIQTIALLMSEPRHKPNLVVAPTVALMQWRNEIEKHTANALSVLVFHGANRSGDTKALKNYDVIMTTYSVLESMYRKQQHGFKRKDGLVKENSVLHKVQFHRVILDEAHNIKDRSCNTAKAVFALKTKYKLCLSGTPLQNRIGEFFSLLRFLEADPFSYYFCRACPCKSLHWQFSDHKTCDSCGHRPMDHCNWFNAELLRPIQAHGNEGEGKLAFEKLRKILGHIMLRRTKVDKADDLGLPTRIIKDRKYYFNEEESDLYNHVYRDSRRRFDTYVAQGVVLSNYANIFTLLTRLRQLADHPDLLLRKHAQEGQNTLVCCICDDEAEEAIASKCRHHFCRLCVSNYLQSYDGEGVPDCPQCHVALCIDLTQPAIESFNDAKKGSIINRINMNNWKSSTKIEALVEELYKLRSTSQTIKSIVFSQFTSMLQLVEWRLHRGGFKTVMLEGSMSPPQRDAVIKHFMETPSVEVFLVSLKAGGVALNLTEASQVFILDPWWNPSVEWQSGDRVHRIGQKRSCKITRLVIDDSIEKHIVELQKKKANMINATVNGDVKSMDKLTAADMQFLFQN